MERAPMARASSIRLGILTLAASFLLLCITPTSRLVGAGIPARLDDGAFWSLITEFSEPGGYFRSDNLVSNETAFQHVIPALQEQLRPASAYLGVGPDQNFTYIAAFHPRIAFIVDIRRQNMLLHLMYKAVLEAAPTRADFLSLLFSRARPASTTPSDTADALFTAFDGSTADPRLFDRNLREVTRRLTKQHHFSLSTDDLRSIEYVYRSFFSAGPDLRYSFGRGPGWLAFPSYRDLMLEDDGQGARRSYLASEANYQALRDLELRNLVVPLVGDFAGPKALRAVGTYLRQRGATVSVFYTSNVEQYLFRGDEWQRFYSNVGALPIDGRSTFIRAYFNNAGRPFFYRVPGPSASGPATSPGVVSLTGPRSETLLNPISILLAAYAEGHISNYYDVIELSR